MARLAAEEKAKKAEEEAIANRKEQQQVAAVEATNGGEEDKKRKKKRERKADEVDEIFAKARDPKKSKMDTEGGEKKVKETVKPKKNREEELGDVLQAIKASM